MIFKYSSISESKALINRELDSQSGPPITENAKTAKDEDWWKDNSVEDEVDENTGDTITRPDGTVMTLEEYKKTVPWYKRAWEGFTSKVSRTFTNEQLRENETMSSYEKNYYTKKVQIGDGKTAGTLSDVALTPLEVTLTIDGCGGIFPGNTIHTHYIPKKYKDRTTLIIKSVSHEISNGGWTTTLETMMTAAFNVDRYGKIEAPDKAERDYDVTIDTETDKRRIQNKKKYDELNQDLMNEDGSPNESYNNSEEGYKGKGIKKRGYHRKGTYVNSRGQELEK